MYGVQLDITFRRVLWYMPLDFRIGGSLNYVNKSCKCYRYFVKSIDYTIRFEKYTLPLSTVVLKLPVLNTDFTESIIKFFIISKFTQV